MLLVAVADERPLGAEDGRTIFADGFWNALMSKDVSFVLVRCSAYLATALIIVFADFSGSESS